MDAITLTPLGKQTAEDTTGKGPEFAVLSLLYEANGPVDVDEVMDSLHADDEKASMLIHRLINKGLVKEL